MEILEIWIGLQRKGGGGICRPPWSPGMIVVSPWVSAKLEALRQVSFREIDFLQGKIGIWVILIILSVLSPAGIDGLHKLLGNQKQKSIVYTEKINRNLSILL